MADAQRPAAWRVRLASAVALTAGLALACAAPAGADVIDVIKDCRDGTVDGRYTTKELRAAQRNLPSDQVEYGDCADALRQAQLDARRRTNDSGGDQSGAAGAPSGGGGSGSGSGAGSGGGGVAPSHGPGQGGSPRTQGERKAQADQDLQALTQDIGKASKGPPPELRVGAARVAPRGAAASNLPLPVVLAMIGAGLLGLAGAWHATKRRFGAPLAALRLRR